LFRLDRQGFEFVGSFLDERAWLAAKPQLTALQQPQVTADWKIKFKIFLTGFSELKV
jgi:hypothetical protein